MDLGYPCIWPFYFRTGSVLFGAFQWSAGRSFMASSARRCWFYFHKEVQTDNIYSWTEQDFKRWIWNDSIWIYAWLWYQQCSGWKIFRSHLDTWTIQYHKDYDRYNKFIPYVSYLMVHMIWNIIHMIWAIWNRFWIQIYVNNPKLKFSASIWKVFQLLG